MVRIGSGLSSLNIPVDPSQCRRAIGLLNSRSIGNRSKANDFITSYYRNNTNIACSLISVNNIILPLSLFSVLFFLKDNVSESSRHFLISILFSTAILLIPFVFFYNLLVFLSSDVEVNQGPNWKLKEALSICHWNLSSISKHHVAKLYL